MRGQEGSRCSYGQYGSTRLYGLEQFLLQSNNWKLSSVVTAVRKFGNLLYARSFLLLSHDWKYCYKYLVTAILNFKNPICMVIFASGT